MKRNYSFHTDKFSLFLFGMGAGLLSMVSTAYAQTQLTPLVESAPVIRSPRELMPALNWKTPSTTDADNLTIRSPAMLNRVIVNPELAKTALEVPRKHTDSIRVDSSVFDLNPTNETDTSLTKTSVPNQPEFKRLQPLKFPVRWNRLQPIEQPQQESVAKSETPRVVASRNVTTVELTEAEGEYIAAKQIAASSEGPETAIPQASLAYLRKPMDIVDPTKFARPVLEPIRKPMDIVAPTKFSRPVLEPIRKPMDIVAPTKIARPILRPIRTPQNALLQPINAPAPVIESTKEKVTEQVSLANTPNHDFQTPLPTGPISLFVNGPDYLSVNQIGDYEIAVANSSFSSTSVSSISLQVPNGVEIIAVQREAKIDDQKRTLTWSIDQIESGKQQRIRFRAKSASARKAGFPVTVSQDGRESQTVSQMTIIR